MRSRLEDYHANDLAEVFPQLKISERRKICRILDLDILSDIFEHIDEQAATEYLDEMEDLLPDSLENLKLPVDELRETKKKKKDYYYTDICLMKLLKKR